MGSPQKGAPFLYCWYRSSELRAPTAGQTCGVFHRLGTMKNVAVCCTSIWNVQIVGAEFMGKCRVNYILARYCFWFLKIEDLFWYSISFMLHIHYRLVINQTSIFHSFINFLLYIYYPFSINQVTVFSSFSISILQNHYYLFRKFVRVGF